MYEHYSGARDMTDLLTGSQEAGRIVGVFVAVEVRGERIDDHQCGLLRHSAYVIGEPPRLACAVEHRGARLQEEPIRVRDAVVLAPGHDPQSISRRVLGCDVEDVSA